MEETDIIFPKGNEKQLVKRAKELNIKSLCFVYPPEEYRKITKDPEKTIQDNEIDLSIGVVVKDKKTRIKDADLVVFDASEFYNKDQDKSNALIEAIKAVKPDIIMNVELSSKNDFIHHRRSGLNHVILNEMKMREVIYGINFGLLLKEFEKESEKGKSRFEIISGRILQNLFLAKKSGSGVSVFSFADNADSMRQLGGMKSFFKVNGTDSKTVSRLFSLVSGRIEKNRKISSGKTVCEGIELA